MLRFFIRKLKNHNGAMENILVTLLLVIVGVAAVIGLSSWVSTEEEAMRSTTSSKVQEVTTKLSE